MGYSEKQYENYIKIVIRNMYELEGKRTDEIAAKLHISEAKVVNVLEKAGLI